MNEVKELAQAENGKLGKRVRLCVQNAHRSSSKFAYIMCLQQDLRSAKSSRIKSMTPKCG